MEEIEQTPHAPSVAPAAPAAPDKPSAPPLMQRVANRVFGYDYFISYAHADGGVYAQALAEELRKRGRQCFLDLDQYRIGDDWKGVGHWTLRRTTCLIVVGSPAALKSGPVAHEVRLFQTMNNQIVPIDFDGSLTDEAPDSELRALLPDTILRLREGRRLEVGPSEEALSRIVGDFKGITQNRKRVRVLTLAAVVFAVLGAAAAYFGWSSYRNAQAAEANARQAQENARQAALNAEEAKANEARARSEQERAEAEARNASKEAARNSYALSLSTSEAERDPWGALVFALRAAESLPEREPALDLYLSRAVHLADRLADGVWSLPLEEGIRSAVFSPGLERVAVVTDNSRVHAFSLPDGSPLHVPEHVNKQGAATTPVFFEGGRALRVYLRWTHPERPTEEIDEESGDARAPEDVALEAAWNLLSGAVLTPIDDGRISWEVLRFKRMSDIGPEGNGRVGSVKDLAPALRARVTPARGVGQAAQRVVTVSADGRVMSWSRRPAAALVTTAALAKGANWKQAAFAGGRLVTLGGEGTLQAWEVSTGRRLWSLETEGVERIELSPDGSAISTGEAIIDAATGQTAGDLGPRRFDGYDVRRENDAFIGNRKVVSPAAFDPGSSEETFNVGVRDAARAGADEQAHAEPEAVAGVRHNEFIGFLQDGRYLLAGSEGSFRVVEWSGGKTVASFLLGASSRVTPGMAVSLLTRTTRVEPVPGQRRVRLVLRDGPALVANAPGETTPALLIDGGEQSVAAPPRLEAGLDATQALSADGRWLATASKGRLRVWDTRDGQPLTEWVLFAGEARDLQFSADGGAVLLATSKGALVRLPVIFRWDSKPAWLAGLAEALTGLSVAQDGRLVPIPPQRLKELRAQVAARLASDPADTPALRLLRSRLPVASQSLRANSLPSTPLEPGPERDA